MIAKNFTPLIVAFALAAASGPLYAQAPKPCALLTNVDAQTVASATVGEGAEHVLAPTGTYACVYKWAAKNFSPSVEVSVSDASKMYPGTDAKTLKMGLLAGMPNATAVPGVGEAANYRQDSATSGSATAYIKGKILNVTIRAPDAEAKKAQVIGLLKLAASRL